MKTLPFLFLFDKGENILLLHRIDRKTREPIKGWIEPWETPGEAIIRELYEETGIKKQVSDLHKIYEHTIWWLHKIIYTLQLKKDVPTISINHIIEWWEDHDNYGRFSSIELDNLDIDYKQDFMMYIQKILNF